MTYSKAPLPELLPVALGFSSSAPQGSYLCFEHGVQERKKQALRKLFIPNKIQWVQHLSSRVFGTKGHGLRFVPQGTPKMSHVRCASVPLDWMTLDFIRNLDRPSACLVLRLPYVERETEFAILCVLFFCDNPHTHITLHYITLQYSTVQYSTLHYIHTYIHTYIFTRVYIYI